MYEDLKLDDLVIRSSSHTPFFGVYLAAHAITDALCMCHASVGCKVKTQQHLVGDDGGTDSHNRMRYSQFIDEDLIQGSTEQLESEISAFARRLGSQLVLIDSSTPISLQAQPLGPVVERMRQKTGVDVLAVATRNYQDDLYAGVAATQAAIFRRQFERFEANVQSDEVSVLGLPFDRFEGDCQGNVAELRRLLAGIGLRAPSVYLAGEPYAALSHTTQARAHLVLPWAHATARELQKVPGVTPDSVHKLGVPMGYAATARWLGQVAQALQIPQARVDAFRTAELQVAKPMAELARRRLRGHRYAAFAEAPRLAGLVLLLQELDMAPAVLAVTHFRPGGQREVEAMLAEHGVTLPSDVQWLSDPTPQQVHALAGDGDSRRPLDGVSLVIGTSIERELLAQSGVAFLEFGFPSEQRHFLQPAPWLGYRGALRLAEQVMQTITWQR